MTNRLEPIREFPCTYPDCAKSFKSIAQMKVHKQEEPEHNYCKKCDVDCDSWVDLTQHKVDAMSPFLEGKMKGSDESPKHIVCEFCGEDFRSFSGRRRHREQSHRADQSIVCPGCKYIFVRAAHMVSHLETDRCYVISKDDFYNRVNDKYMFDEIKKNTDVVMETLTRLGAFGPSNDTPGLIADVSGAEDEEEDGGVPIFDQVDQEQSKGYQPLQADVDLIDLKFKAQKLPSMRQNLETWPRLSDLVKATETMTVTSDLTRTGNTDKSNGIKSHTDAFPPLPSFGKHAANQMNAIQSVITKVESLEMARTWTPIRTSKKLFKDAKPNMPKAEKDAIVQQEEDEKRLISGAVVRSRFWDIRSEEWDPRRLYDSAIDKYVCFMPTCPNKTFDTTQDLWVHFRMAHRADTNRYHCPTCLKLFQRPSALIAHGELSTTCSIQKNKNFETMVDNFSGGFLEAEDVTQQRIYSQSTDVVKSDQPEEPAVKGVMTTRYKAKMPQDAWESHFG